MKKYKLTFHMTDGTTEDVEFSVPSPESGEGEIVGIKDIVPVKTGTTGDPDGDEGKTVGIVIVTTDGKMRSFDLYSGYDGKSAYDIAVAEGFEGDVTAWLASLKGDPYTLTEADKSAIVEAVVEALPKYDGEVEIV